MKNFEKLLIYTGILIVSIVLTGFELNKPCDEINYIQLLILSVGILLTTLVVIGLGYNHRRFRFVYTSLYINGGKTFYSPWYDGRYYTVKFNNPGATVQFDNSFCGRQLLPRDIKYIFFGYVCFNIDKTEIMDFGLTEVTGTGIFHLICRLDHVLAVPENMIQQVTDSINPDYDGDWIADREDHKIYMTKEVAKQFFGY